MEEQEREQSSEKMNLRDEEEEDGAFHRSRSNELTPPPELPLTPAHLGNMGEGED